MGKKFYEMDPIYIQAKLIMNKIICNLYTGISSDKQNALYK